MLTNAIRTIKTKTWCVVICVIAMVIIEVSALNGPNVCMVKQKYNITKRVKYRAPMSVRTYEWCFSMPPRCSRWNTEMRDLTRLETEERVAEVAVCCPGYKMRDVSCVPICPNGKTGAGCSEDCPDNKWGPNCVNECQRCKNGFCSPVTGECECLDGWQGESCDTSMLPATSTMSLEELLTTLTTKTTISNTTPKVTPTVTPTPRKITSMTTVITSTSSVTMPTTTVPKATTVMSTTMTPSITILTTLSPTDTLTTKIINTALMETIEMGVEENVTRPYITTTEMPKLTTRYSNMTFVTLSKKPIVTTEEVTQRIFIKPIYNHTEGVEIIKATEPTVIIKTIPTVNAQQEATDIYPVTEMLRTTIASTFLRENIFKTETTRKETTAKIAPTTAKFKPKEIWIRPAQKGESSLVESKIKPTHELPRYRSANNKELTPAVTTPKTIIVSIIPTSVSYSTFKKIALTSSFMLTKNITNAPAYNKTDFGLSTTAMPSSTTTPSVQLSSISKKETIPTTLSISSTTFQPSTSVTAKTSLTKATSVTESLEATKTIFHINRTNSMTTDINKNTSTFVTATFPNVIKTTQKRNDLLTTPTIKSLLTSTTIQSSTERTNNNFIEHIIPKHTNVSLVRKTDNTTNPPKVIENEIKKANATKKITIVTTDEPIDDEEFHILTEPEHITAVMGDKGNERSSLDLISVISIAGGVMMAVITVAVIIVMIERCKKPRYEDVRKINDIRMQVMIDNNDVPPPYVRSIFHTPLPEPPTSEKCHYQPISTLDRNLKQFMRPVVVQTISPIMLENFRGILECHYDHLPRRSHDFGTIQSRASLVPSMNERSELREMRASVTESTIEALKCEAKLDVIDNTTSEPLYAEIPCWRPPSEHAIEIINLNGEAVTEL